MQRFTAGIFAALATAMLTACGSSTQTVTGPTTNKCAVTATADTASFGAGGGSGNITVSTNRECQWSAVAGTSWVKLGSTSSGQGDGKVPFTVAANSDPTGQLPRLVGGTGWTSSVRTSGTRAAGATR